MKPQLKNTRYESLPVNVGNFQKWQNKTGDQRNIPYQTEVIDKKMVSLSLLQIESGRDVVANSTTCSYSNTCGKWQNDHKLPGIPVTSTFKVNSGTPSIKNAHQLFYALKLGTMWLALANVTVTHTMRGGASIGLECRGLYSLATLWNPETTRWTIPG